MKTIEYRFIDKTEWQDGPWNYEPDKIQWPDEKTGLPCLIRRSSMGFLCGYVGVPPGHPWYGKGYDEVDVNVHGGLTYAEACSEGEPEYSICHVPSEGEPDHVWWLGFDCGHLEDKSDISLSRDFRAEYGLDWMSRGVYRDVPYVRSQIRSLAEQIAAA